MFFKTFITFFILSTLSFAYFTDDYNETIILTNANDDNRAKRYYSGTSLERSENDDYWHIQIQSNSEHSLKRSYYRGIKHPSDNYRINIRYTDKLDVDSLNRDIFWLGFFDSSTRNQETLFGNNLFFDKNVNLEQNRWFTIDVDLKEKTAIVRNSESVIYQLINFNFLPDRLFIHSQRNFQRTPIHIHIFVEDLEV